MTKLADKIEALEGPSREVDAEIAIAVGRTLQVWREGGHSMPGYWADDPPPTYTASLDAAMTLVPEGFYKSFAAIRFGDGLPFAEVVERKPPERIFSAYAATPALALCAAALRAREANR